MAKGFGVGKIVERILAALLLALLSPVLLLLALWVRAVSPGPSLYPSERVGAGGVPFRLFKLRTMAFGAPQRLSADLRTIAEPGDARLIAGGAFLRKGFDELFQMINILRGEMSFIGPRPDLSWMVGNYLPDALPRLSVPPGITGWAQILGSRDLETRERYLLDLWYVAHRSFRLDLAIAAWTPLYILFGLTLPSRIRLACLEAMAGTGPLFKGDTTGGSRG